MKLVLKTSSSNENYNGDCDFALVDITPQLAKLALERIAKVNKLRKRDRMTASIAYWDYSCVFFPWDFNSEVELDVEDELEVEAEFDVPEDKWQSTECDQMIVYDDRVCWQSVPKHSEVDVTTAYIKVETLRKIRLETLNRVQRQWWRLREIIAEMQLADLKPSTRR